MSELRSHFGFTATPFTREIPVDKRFRHPVFDEPLGAIERTVADRMSAAVLAAAGTGKTMLVRALADRLPQARYRVHYVKTASLGRRDMCRELCDALGCEPAGQYNTLVRRIGECLQEQVDTAGLRPVIVIDDAHEMRPDVLGLLRILSNFEMDSRLVVSFILLGQKPLAKLLAHDALEDVARRIAHYATLRNLTREETRSYVVHRQSVAGARADLLVDEAHDCVFEIGGGNLRATDRLCLKALQLAAIESSSAVTAAHVAGARQALWP